MDSLPAPPLAARCESPTSKENQNLQTFLYQPNKTKAEAKQSKADSSCRCRGQLITTPCPWERVLGTVTQQHCSPWDPRPSPLGAEGRSQTPARAAQEPAPGGAAVGSVRPHSGGSN